MVVFRKWKSQTISLGLISRLPVSQHGALCNPTKTVGNQAGTKSPCKWVWGASATTKVNWIKRSAFEPPVFPPFCGVTAKCSWIYVAPHLPPLLVRKKPWALSHSGGFLNGYQWLRTVVFCCLQAPPTLYPAKDTWVMRGVRRESPHWTGGCSPCKYITHMHAKSLQLCPSLYDLMDCSLPGPLSVGFSRQEFWSGFPCPPPGDLSDPGIKPTSVMSPALAGRFFTTSATWEAHITHN